MSILLCFRNDNGKRLIGPPKVPNMSVVPRTQLVRKLEHRLTLEMDPRPGWRNKGPNDDFSLPNLPGGTLLDCATQLVNDLLLLLSNCYCMT